jgi:hypothetical protein
MGRSPTDHDKPEPLDEETKRILDERLKTIDEDRKTARPCQGSAGGTAGQVEVKFSGY